MSRLPLSYKVMTVTLTALLLIVGFVLLIKGADFLVDGASSLALKLSVPEMVIGLTIVAFGTSTPELIVNVFASVQGRDEITVGNIVGSNIFNILFILGISGVIYPIKTEKNTVWKEIPFALMSSVVLLIVSNDVFFNHAVHDVISRSDGIVLLLFFIIFISYVFGISKVEGRDAPEVTIRSGVKVSLLIMAGLIGLIAGGKMVVDSAVKIAQWFSVSEKLIALTIVATGTSLPELFTSAVAAYKRKSDIAIGTIVGSNIFNVFFIMGMSAVIAPVHFQPVLNSDLFVLVGASLLLFATMFTGKRRSLDRWEAVIFIVGYIAYVVYLLIRR